MARRGAISGSTVFNVATVDVPWATCHWLVGMQPNSWVPGVEVCHGPGALMFGCVAVHVHRVGCTAGHGRIVPKLDPIYIT